MDFFLLIIVYEQISLSVGVFTDRNVESYFHLLNEPYFSENGLKEFINRLFKENVALSGLKETYLIISTRISSLRDLGTLISEDYYFRSS